MKSRKEHRIPLSPQVIELLKSLPTEQDNPHVFIGKQPGAHVSVASVTDAQRRNGIKQTLHGTARSAFSDWAHERTSHSNHAIELSLAHNIGNQTEKAYRRGDMFMKRRKLTEGWSKFCCTPPAADAGKVLDMRARRA
jgi:integrase